MPDSSTSPTKAQWKSQLAPLLSVSLREAGECITQAPSVQKWLHTASFEAAEGLGQMDATQAEAEGYWRMMEGLKQRFPELVAAVEELTDGCASLDIHWRPLAPNFTRLYLRTTGDRDCDLVVRLPETTAPAVRTVLQAIVRALPDGTPFPNRPHEATGMVVYNGHCLTVRVREHRGKEGTGSRHTVVLFQGDASSDPLSMDAAIQHIQAFAQAAS